MNKVKYSTLNSFLKLKVSDPAIFARSVSLALGVALARNAPLPTTRPESPRSYYGETVQMGIERAAAEFNENIVIDLDLTWQVARSLWLMRCGMTLPSPYIDLPETNTPGDFFAGLSNAGFTMDPTTYAFLDANRVVIYVMANRISATMNEGNQP